TVEKNLLGQYEVSSAWRKAGDGHAALRRVVAHGAQTAQEALRLAEGYVQADRRVVVRLTSADASWRGTPASEKQIAMLRRRKIPIKPGLTKGEASGLIDLAMARRERA